jgi:hypothetical protein
VKKATADSVLGKSKAEHTPIYNAHPDLRPGYVSNDGIKKFKYHEVIKDCRYYYERDPIAGTVVNRLCEIAVTQLRNRRQNKNAKNALSDEIIAYYNAIAEGLKPFLKQMALEYTLHGLAIPEFTTIRKMGNRASDKLGRTRYHFPDKLWIRNVDNIEIVKLPTGAERVIFLKVPAEEIRLIETKGGKDPNKKALYEILLERFPEYVAAVQAGKTRFPLNDVAPVYRKLTSYNDYPIPYLLNALDPMKHKGRLKSMDMSIASRIIEAIRQVKVGNDEYPADDDDLRAEQQSFLAYGSVGEKIFNYFTNHTVEIKWVYPPFEQLLSEGKYIEPNREIFMALGFPRIWVTGETEKSNASDNSLASQGPLATIEDIRDQIIQWVKWFYNELAELNNFDRIPEPYFAPIVMADVANLIQYAADFYDKKAISRETMAALYGEDYEQVAAQREAEEKIDPTEDPIAPNPNQPTNINQVNTNPEGENEDPPTEQTSTQTE